MVGEGVAVGVGVGSAMVVIVAVGKINGVGEGVGVEPKGRGVGIGAKISGEIVGGVLPSTELVHATASDSTNGALTAAIRLRLNFIPQTFRANVNRELAVLQFMVLRPHAFFTQRRGRDLTSI